jgi:hypothetical protein
MHYPSWVTAKEIDDWAKSATAKFVLPELIRRLVLVTVERENLKAISFPAHEEAQLHGYDGRTSTDRSTTHVPDGLCVWELSCKICPGSSAPNVMESSYDISADSNRGASPTSAFWFFSGPVWARF